jgi:hypothetical protein
MKTAVERMRTRLSLGKDRPWTEVSLRLPDDVIEDLKEIAPMLGMSGHVPLMRTYIGQGLRKDMERLEDSQLRVQALTKSLRKQGVPDEVISVAIAEAGFMRV